MGQAERRPTEEHDDPTLGLQGANHIIQVTLDGQPQNGPIIPLVDDGGEHHVELTIDKQQSAFSNQPQEMAKLVLTAEC